NVLQGNYIGTDVTGTTAKDPSNNPIGNAFSGVEIIGAQNNTIGGTAAAARNVISGNMQDGVYISDAVNVFAVTAFSTGNLVQGNFVGTDKNGTAALPNSLDGIQVENAHLNTITGNVASANSRNGIQVDTTGAEAYNDGLFVPFNDGVNPGRMLLGSVANNA